METIHLQYLEAVTDALNICHLVHFCDSDIVKASITPETPALQQCFFFLIPMLFHKNMSTKLNFLICMISKKALPHCLLKHVMRVRRHTKNTFFPTPHAYPSANSKIRSFHPRVQINSLCNKSKKQSSITSITHVYFI